MPPLSAHRSGATFVSRTIRRSRAAWRRMMYAGTASRRARSRNVASTAARKPAGVAYSRTFAGLLNCSFDKLSNTRRAAPHGCAQFVRRHETCGECSRRCFDDHAGISAEVGDVGNGPSGRRDLDAETACDLLSSQRPGCRVQPDGGCRLCGAWSALAREREVDLVRARRRQFVQRERGVV